MDYKVPSENKRPKCFVIRPFSRSLQNIWDLVIQPAADTAGYFVFDAAESNHGLDVIHRDISRSIWEADVIVALISGRNPNVFYELGLAHAAKKTVVMMIDKEEQAPFDIAHIRFLQYDLECLKEARDSLIETLEKSKLNKAPKIDFYPELEIFDSRRKSLYQEAMLRMESLIIDVKPKSSDIFVNGKLNQRSQIIKINPDSESNTISIGNVGFFEFYEKLENYDTSKKKIINIELEKASGNNLTEKVQRKLPGWLRDKRKNPHDPVLMRAISSYLLMMEEYEEAYKEIIELNDICPEWHLSRNQLGFYFGITNQSEKALREYKIVTEMCDYHYIGHYNCACILSTLENFDECIYHLEKIISSSEMLDSIQDSLRGLRHDSDFEFIANDPSYRENFLEIEKFLFPSSTQEELDMNASNSFHTFW